MQVNLEGRRALVTGGSAGIGQASARLLAMNGASVVTAARGGDRLVAQARDLAEASGQKVVGVAADVTRPDECERLVEQAVAELGGIDILVNCAGGTRPLAPEAPEDAWRESFELNFWPAMRLTHLLVPGMAERKFGRIVNITGSSEPKSMQYDVTNNLSSYMNAATPAKAAVHAWAKGLSRQYGPAGITVNSIPPGRIVTEQVLRNHPDEAQREAHVRAHVPLQRWGHVDEFASLVLYLCSDEGGYITGEVIHVDGGMRNFAF